MALEIGLAFGRIGIPAAHSHHAFDVGTEALLVERERGSDGSVEYLGVEADAAGAFGDGDRIGRIAEGDESVRAELLDLAHDGTHVLRLDRVRSIVNEF